MRKAKIRPFKGVMSAHIYCDSYEASDLLDFAAGMGYYIYEDPTQEELMIISDRQLTYRDLKKMAKRFDIDLDWWNNTTDFNDRLDEELDELHW